MSFTITLKTPEGENTIQCEDDQYILDAADEAGFALLCVAYPESDCVIETEKEEELY